MCNKIMMQNDVGILSIPYDRIDEFKELLVDFYETDNSKQLKEFFHNKCLLLNPEYNKQITEEEPKPVFVQPTVRKPRLQLKVNMDKR